MKPKIIEVTAVGISQVKLLYRLNDCLLKEGYEVHALCAPDAYINGIQKEIKYHPVGIGRSIHLNRNISAVKEMVDIFKSVAPDIVHVHTPLAAVLARIAAKIAGVPHVIYTAHGFYFHDGMHPVKYRLVHGIEKFFCQYFTDYLFTQSAEDYALAVSDRFIRASHAAHISNGIDLDTRFNPGILDADKKEGLKASLGIKNNTVVFSFLGRMVKEKGILDLLHAFSIVHAEYPDTMLICMGGALDSDRDTSTRHEVEAFKRHPAVTFTGQVRDPEYYYSISDIFILPSYREGMPRSIIEAMAMENAVIATNIRGSREEVIHGLNGFLVTPGSVRALVEHMKYLIGHPERIDEMKRESFKRTQELYNEQSVVDSQLEVFNRITGG